jgi:hypothetical protein
MERKGVGCGEGWVEELVEEGGEGREGAWNSKIGIPLREKSKSRRL